MTAMAITIMINECMVMVFRPRRIVIPRGAVVLPTKNDRLVAIGSGMVTPAMNITYHRAIYDDYRFYVTTCNSVRNMSPGMPCTPG